MLMVTLESSSKMISLIAPFKIRSMNDLRSAIQKKIRKRVYMVEKISGDGKLSFFKFGGLDYVGTATVKRIPRKSRKKENQS